MLYNIQFISYLLPSPNTGDEAKPWLWIGLAIGVVGLAIVFILMSKRDKSDDDDE